MKKRARIIISGRVQGVGFRSFVQLQAQKLGVCGWVKNNQEGTVEAVLEGEQEAIEHIITACKDGSMSANVEHINTKEEAYTGEFNEFRINKKCTLQK